MAGLRSPREARREITTAASSLDVRAVLTDNLPPEYKPAGDETPVICETTDNANTVRDHVALTKLGIGATFCGWSLTDADMSLMAREYGNLPQVNSESVRMQALTPAEETLLERTASLRDMQALRVAALALQREGGDGMAAASPADGDGVSRISSRARRPKSHQAGVLWNTQSPWDVMDKVDDKGKGMFVKEIIITNEYINEDSTLSIH